MVIAKIIHMTWKTKQLPVKYQTNLAKWRELHPDYKINIYDDNDLDNFICNYFPEFKQLYQSFNKPILKVNFARYAILYQSGGIYADMDTYPVKSFNNLLNSKRIILASEAVEHCERYQRGQILCNAIMLSPVQNGFWYRLMTFIQDNNNNTRLALTNFVEQYPIEADQINVLPSCYFYPLLNSNYHSGIKQKIGNKTFNNVSKLCDPNKTYAVHHWDDSWQEDNYNLKLIIFLILIILLIVIFIIMLSK